MTTIKTVAAGLGFLLLALSGRAKAQETECRTIIVESTLCVGTDCESWDEPVELCRAGWDRPETLTIASLDPFAGWDANTDTLDPIAGL